MNVKVDFPVTSRFLTLMLLMMAFFLYSKPVNAQRKPSPNVVLEAGSIVTTAIGSYVNGYFTQMGENDAKKRIQSQQPYTIFYYVQMPDGLYYKVCQNFQNQQPISYGYWCR
jgi:hypothetical protein